MIGKARAECLKLKPSKPLITIIEQRKSQCLRGGSMDKKNLLGILFCMGLFSLVITGMVAFQPEVAPLQTADYEMRGFPSLPSER